LHTQILQPRRELVLMRLFPFLAGDVRNNTIDLLSKQGVNGWKRRAELN